MTNVACACGLTSSNYKEMVDLYNKYNKDGLEVKQRGVDRGRGSLRAGCLSVEPLLHPLPFCA